jgi:hypothetical protein
MQPAEGDDSFEYSGLDMRLGLTGTWSSEGVTAAANFKVSQRAAGANMSVDVAGGIAVVTGNDVSLQGAYMCSSDAVTNLTIPAAPGSGSRTHRVILWVKDKLYDGTLAANTYEFVLAVQEDTTGSGPDDDLPDSAISLATVTVAASQTSVTDADITDTRISALTTSSWLRQIDSDTERPAIPLSGEQIFRTDLSCVEISDGTFWYEMPHRDSGGTTSGLPWTPYDPSLTGTTSNPTLGSGATADGWYYWLGSLVFVTGIIKFGTSGVSAGSGFYEISLPVDATTLTVGRRTGTAYVYDNSAQDFYDGICFINNNENGKVRISINSAVVTNASPITFAASDEIGFTIVFEAAP